MFRGPQTVDSAGLDAGIRLFHILLIVNGLVILALGFLASRWQRLALAAASPLYLIPRLPRSNSRTDHPLVLYAIFAGAFLLCLLSDSGEGSGPIQLAIAALAVMGLWTYYRFAQRIVPWPEPLLGVVALALATPLVICSPNALAETVLLVGTSLGSSLFLRNLRRPRVSHWIVYAAVMALALFIHGAAAIILACHGLIYFSLLLRKALRGGEFVLIDGLPLGGLVLCGLLTVQLYALALPEVVASFAGLNDLVGGQPWAPPLGQVRQAMAANPFATAAILGVAGLAAVGAMSLSRTNRLVAALLVLPGAVGLAVLVLFPMHVSPRVLIVALPLAVVSVVHGATVLARAMAERGCRRPHFR
jgi:hypothetical protein